VKHWAGDVRKGNEIDGNTNLSLESHVLSDLELVCAFKVGPLSRKFVCGRKFALSEETVLGKVVFELLSSCPCETRKKAVQPELHLLIKSQLWSG